MHVQKLNAVERQYEERVYSNAGLPELVALFREEDRLVLDIGCGAGDNARLLEKRGKIVHGVTLSQEEYQIASRVMQRVILANVETWEWDYEDGFFDALLLSHVLEHTVDPERTLRRLRRLLRVGGRVYIALPNVVFWRQRLLFLLGRFDYDEAGIMDRTHLRFYTYSAARELLGHAGFRLVSARARGSAPLRPLRRVFPRFAKQIDDLCCKLWPNLFGADILLVGEKTE